MRVLLIGKGGREHAIAWKISQSELLSKLYLWPGNPGMAALGDSLPISASADFATLIVAAKQAQIDLVVSGPEAPLSEGLADAFAASGIPTFGPVQAVAQLESSKEFAKQMMAKAEIPTAAYRVAHNEAECRQYALDTLESSGGVVLKASGLAAGKGVFVCRDALDVTNGLERLYHSDMKDAAASVVIEEVLLGRECSYFCFLGEAGPLSLGFAVDYKRLNDGDEGPNTGGMGCYAPVPWLPEDAAARVQEAVVQPLLKALKKEGLSYQGCLYVGLMWSPTKGPQVVEFNVRLGDPEAQVLALYDDRDWLAWMAASCGLNAGVKKLTASAMHPVGQTRAVAVVMAAASYPYGNDPGMMASLPEAAFANPPESSVMTFAANVTKKVDGVCVTSTGRVLTVCARASTFAAARKLAYARVDELAQIWGGARWRRDIALAVES
ncbi:MAG: phosphoribosylamine--glycine ligase [Deltaproteobacteria bacterium]|nr:phosphoribosylamine--glycine ligase [Deltaproteobacteria bacterium]